MTKRSYMAVPFVLGALLLILTGYWGYTQNESRKNLQTNLGNRYQMAFLDLSTHVEKLQVLLAKGLVSSSPEQDLVIFSDIRNEATSAQGDLGQLPLANPALTRTNQYLSQVGDFAYTLNKQRARGKAPTDEDWDKLAQLQEQAGALNQELKKMEVTVADGAFNWGEFRREANEELAVKGRKRGQINLVKLERNMEQFPVLIYDGPFSDHLERVKPRGIKGKVVSREKARNIALQFVDKGEEKWQAVYRGKVNGKIPAHRIEVKPTGAAGVFADISIQGGKIIWFLNPRTVDKENLTMEQARQKAANFLTSRGYGKMAPTYSVKQQNIAYFSFAYLQDNVLVYPDLIKVRVALDNGQILGIEAMGYLMSHAPRKIPEAKVSREQARTMIHPRLDVQAARMVIIPTETLKEIFCYEFKVMLNGQQFLIYINALTGQQEKILEVIDTPNGTLTM
ncbi:MAG: germination protein YpeB [Clostridia bacterium]|nr:germination protein YpeB [Clostridia bacterium]